MRNREEYANLEATGRAIVDNCGGVPLAIKSIGSLMRLKKNESEWLSMERSEIWDLQEEGSKILLALRLSYTNLKSHLKQSFSFCCDMGNEIFNELVGRSFFQEVKEDELGYITCKRNVVWLRGIGCWRFLEWSVMWLF
jgi:structure-specific endonuclease subunit SLX1